MMDLDVVKLSLSGDRCVLAPGAPRGEAVVQGGEQSWGGGGQEIPSIVPSSPKDSSLGETFDSWGFPLCLQVCHGKSWENPSEEPEPCHSPSLSSSELAGDAAGKKKKRDA